MQVFGTMSDSKNSTSGRRLSFPEKQKVQIEVFELPPLQEREVLVKTALSLMSTGTENIVFNRLFEPGTHWDNWVKYPFFLAAVRSGPWWNRAAATSNPETA